MLNNIWVKIKNIYSKKRWWAVTIIVFLIIVGLATRKTGPTISVLNIVNQNLKQTVTASGIVTSTVDLNLSFNTSGIVRKLNVAVGDQVKKNDILAALDQGAVSAELTSARGALLSANAKYQKILDGASSAEIKVAEVYLENAKIDLENTIIRQKTLVDNAYFTLLNSTLTASSNSGAQSSAPTISGYYKLGQEGVYKINVYNTGSGAYFSYSGIESGSAPVSTSSGAMLGSGGLYLTFPTSGNLANTEFEIKIPNTQATDYSANLSAYENAKKSSDQAIAQAKSNVAQKQADLELKKSSATNAELDLARADVLSAQGKVQSAQSAYENTIIRAPQDATVTAVDIKLGELGEMQKPVITIQDTGNLYVEAKINESNIPTLELSQVVTFTIDAFGPDKVFEGEISHIDPSATVESGIVNYKVDASISANDLMIRPGMNANLTILIAEKSNILAVPEASLVRRDGKTFVNIITKLKDDEYAEREITTGKTWDGNLVEVISGLKAGDNIAILEKSK